MPLDPLDVGSQEKVGGSLSRESVDDGVGLKREEGVSSLRQARREFNPYSCVGTRGGQKLTGDGGERGAPFKQKLFARNWRATMRVPVMGCVE